MAFWKKGLRKQKINTYKAIKKDLKNMNSINTESTIIAQFVVSMLLLREEKTIPSREEILDLIAISAKELEAKMNKRYFESMVNGILENIKLHYNAKKIEDEQTES